MEEDEPENDKEPKSVIIQQLLGGVVCGGLCMILIPTSRALGAWFIAGPLAAPGVLCLTFFSLFLRTVPEAENSLIANWLGNPALNLNTFINIISSIPPFVIGFLYPKKEYRGLVGVIFVVYLGVMLSCGLFYAMLKGSVLDN